MTGQTIKIRSKIQIGKLEKILLKWNRCPLSLVRWLNRDITWNFPKEILLSFAVFLIRQLQELNQERLLQILSTLLKIFRQLYLSFTVQPTNVFS